MHFIEKSEFYIGYCNCMLIVIYWKIYLPILSSSFVYFSGQPVSFTVNQHLMYVFLVNVKSVFQPVFANHSIDRVLCILSSRQNWDPPPSHTGEGAPPPPLGSEGKDTLTGGRGGGEEVPKRTREQTLCYSRYISTLWRQLPHGVYHCPTPQNCTWGGGGGWSMCSTALKKFTRIEWKNLRNVNSTHTLTF